MAVIDVPAELERIHALEWDKIPGELERLVYRMDLERYRLAVALSERALTPY